MPANTKKFAPLVFEAGGDIIVVQSTVTTPGIFPKSYRDLFFQSCANQLKIPIIVGNCVSYNACL